MLCPLPRTAVVSCAGPGPSTRRGHSIATRQGWGRFTNAEVLCSSRCFPQGLQCPLSLFHGFWEIGPMEEMEGAVLCWLHLEEEPVLSRGSCFVKLVILDAPLLSACNQIWFCSDLAWSHVNAVKDLLSLRQGRILAERHGAELSGQVRSQPGQPRSPCLAEAGNTCLYASHASTGCDPSLLLASSRAGPPWSTQHRRHPYACPLRDQSGLHNVLWRWASQVKLFPMWKEGVISHILSLFQLNKWCYKFI